MLRFDKMTVKAQEALQQANDVAARHENQQIEPVHLLEALVSQTDGVVPPLLARLGIRSEALTQEIEREIALAESARLCAATPGEAAEQRSGARVC